MNITKHTLDKKRLVDLEYDYNILTQFMRPLRYKKQYDRIIRDNRNEVSRLRAEIVYYITCKYGLDAEA